MTTEEHADLLMKQIRQHMRENKITQNKVAERSDVSIWTLSNVFNGKRGLHFDTFIRILEALGLDKNYEKLD